MATTGRRCRELPYPRTTLRARDARFPNLSFQGNVDEELLRTGTPSAQVEGSNLAGCAAAGERSKAHR